MASREEPIDQDTQQLLEDLVDVLPWPLYQRVREELLWRDEQIRVLKRVVHRLIKREYQDKEPP